MKLRQFIDRLNQEGTGEAGLRDLDVKIAVIDDKSGSSSVVDVIDVARDDTTGVVVIKSNYRKALNKHGK